MTKKTSPEAIAFDNQVAKLKALGYTLEKTSLKGYTSFYDGQSYHAYKEIKKKKSDWGNYTYNVYTGRFGFNTGGSNYCCGQMEFGQFENAPEESDEDDWDDEPANLSQVSMECWECLIKMMQIVERDNGFAQTATLATPDFVTLEKALRACGFKKIKTVPSKHARGKYDINIWQWNPRTSASAKKS